MDDYDDYDDEEYGLEKEDDELYDDDYDSSDEDELDDDYDNYDDDLDDESLDADDDGYHDASYYEALGIDDGRFDREHHMLPHSGFGSSVNLDELSDDQREAYELGYGIGAEDYDLSDDE
ncbi:hypothetical protein IKG38_02125 [Candidatus Saccharibacteria bacterium]|nr:hypothetical protein [Candidatus Saccharibacteria bacterium]